MDEQQTQAGGADLDSLEQFAAQLTRKTAETDHRGLRVKVRSFGSPSAFSSLVLGWFYGVLDRLFKKRRGWSIKVYLPRTLAFDLWLESRWRKQDDASGLDRRFLWTAIDRQAVEQVLAGDLLTAIEGMSDEHGLLLTDEWLRVGPVSPAVSKRQLAEVIDAAVDLAQRLSAMVPEDDQGADLDSEPLPEPEGDFKVVHRCTDSLQAEFVRSVLTRHGIPSQVIGTRVAALIGAAPHIFRLKVRVPESMLARAVELLDKLRADPELSKSSWIESQQEVIFQKKRAVAFGMCFFLPGGGHFYSLRPVTASFIGLTILAGMFAALFLSPANAGVMVMVVGILADLLGSQLTFSTLKKGHVPRVGGQALAGLAWMVAIIGTSLGLLVLLGLAAGSAGGATLYLPFFYW